MAELDEGRARFAEGEATVNRAQNELLRANASLTSVKEALGQSRSLAALRTSERDTARAEVVRLDAELAEARNDIAGLQGAVATARLQVLGGIGSVAIAETWIARLRADVAYAEVRLAETETGGRGAPGAYRPLRRALRSTSTRSTRRTPRSSPTVPTGSAGCLSRVLDLQARNTRFSSANKPSVGFNSPGFTGYVLGRVVRGKSLKSLAATETPQLGDIIRYENGFDMFLLEDAEGEPFVIGMTPVGIAALEPDFGVPRAGALATGIFQQ